MAGQTFTLNFDAKLNVAQMKGAIGSIQGELNRLQLPQNLTKGITGTLTSLEKELRNFEVAAGKDLGQKNNFSAFERSAERISSLFKDLQIQARDLGQGVSLDKFFPQDVVQTINQAKTALKNYEAEVDKLNRKVSSQKGQVTKATAAQKVAEENLKAALKPSQDQLKNFATEYKQILTGLFNDIKVDPKNLFDQASLDQAVSEAQKRIERLQQIQNNINTKGQTYKYADSTKEKAKAEEAALTELIAKYNLLREAQSQQSDQVKKLQDAYDAATNKVKIAQVALQDFENTAKAGTTDALNKLITELNKLGIDTTGITNIDQAKAALAEFSKTAEGEAAAALEKLRSELERQRPTFDNTADAVRQSADAYRQFNDSLRDVSSVKSRIQYFFGLNNAINLIKRGIREAISTVKDLDKAMTETAVVTSNTISDMWQKLPDYTKRANELGVSTLEAYQAATLYYQQGLNDDQAAALSVETLKMARIAGLEAADATDRMTNALRGFNMELNEVSAQKVDDVYSQLAAMSASNVDEISTAMTKVASLAHSANMEFETTAAFLAQIIETTRESAETAGTALKTVVARFSEVKKLYDMDELKGKDEEGQNIDVNKVSSALRTAGIDLNKYFLGEVGLDDIFMELASKWDSLTSVQQRYIATQAAGSRQQSRFIALMQDYARTQQLVSAAYNANGASAKQFEKTQESLQSKLARLKNAWDEFLMGLANNSIIKGVVDGLTTLLNIVNKLTGAFGTGAGFVLKWVAAVSAFRGIKSLFKTGGFLDLAIMGGLQAGGKGALANAAVRTGLLSGLMRKDGAVSVADILRGEAAQTAAVNATAMAGPRTPLIFGSGSLLSQASKGLWDNAKALGLFMQNGGLAGKVSFSGAQAASGFAGVGAGLTGIATAFGAIAAAAATAYGAYQLWLNLSPKGQLKNAQKYADAMSEAATNAQKQASELQKASKQVKDYDNAISQASTSTERRQAIEDRNNYIESLLEQDSRYAEYLTTTFEDGQMVLKLNIDASALDTAIKGATMAQAGSDFAQAAVADRQANLARSMLRGVDLENKRIRYTTGADGGAISDAWRDMTNAEIAQYSKYQAQIAQAQSQFNTYAQKAFSELIPTDQVSDEISELMSSALAKGFNETELPTGSGWWATRSHWQNEYLKAYGTEASSEMKTADIYRAVKQYELTEGRALQVDKLTELLRGESKDIYQGLLEGFTGKGRLTSQNLLGLNEKSEEEVYKFLGLNTNNIDQLTNQLDTLADALGVTRDELRESIRRQVQTEKRQQARNVSSTIGQMLNGQGGMPSQQNIKNIASFINLEDTQAQQLFSQMFSSIDPSLLTDELVGNILEGLKSGSGELNDWFKTIDFSNPIQAINKLSFTAKNADGIIQQTAQSLLTAAQQSEKFSSSAQLGYFLTSSSFDSMEESLGKFIDENGKITSSNVLDLAEANSDLNSLLENNITSAGGLARILTELSQGTINVWDLSDAVIAATAAMDDLDGIVAKTISDLNSFDPGYDENDVTKFIQKALDVVNDNIGKGATGNNQLRNYMEYIFGDFKYNGSKEDYGAAYESWLNERVAWLEANKDNMFSAWSDFANTLTNQELKLFDEQGNVIHEAARVWQDGEEIFIEANGMTTDQLIQAMVQTGKLTEQQARMMITDFKNYSSDFAHEMGINDLPNAIQAWIDKLPSVTDGTKIFDEKDYQTLAHLLDISKQEVEDYVKGLQDAQGKINGITLTPVSFTDSKGNRTKDSITKGWQQAGIDITSMMTQSWHINEDKGTDELVNMFDFDAIKENYQKAGMAQMFEQDFQTILGKSRQFTTQMFDEQRTVTIQAGQTAGEAYAQEYQKAVNEHLAGQIGEAIAKELEELGEGEGAKIKFIANFDELPEKAPDLPGEVGYEASFNFSDADVPTLHGFVNYTSHFDDNSVAHQAGIGASGGIVQSYASGSENIKLQPGTALTGEEGPEIVWNKEKGYAYITGENHPEFQNLQPGDRVFNAQETKKILGGAATGGVVPSLARGYGAANAAKKTSGGGSGGSRGGGGSGGDKDKTPEEWKNELDWLYNLMEDIAELERDQKAIEEQYEDYLADQTKTGGDLYRLLVKQLGNLYTQLNHQTFALEKREQEMREFMDTTNDKDEYLWYNWEDRTLEIDWDAIDQITDEEEYKHVKELIDEAEEIQGKMDDADDAIMDITNQIQELENIWRDTFTDFEDRVLDAIVKSYQQVIDKYSELNDTLNNSNTQILDSLQKQISLERQIRDNTKTEEEITDEEARLAYLRRDTSGGNDLAALQLEKELADQRENYEDTLVDQAINRLQEDNDAAAQQRERQIEIMQAQLDYQSENGEFNAYVRELLTSAMGADGELLTNSDLVALLKEQENWDAMSEVSKQVWDEELNGTFKEVAAFLLKENAEQNGTFYTALTEAVKTVSTAIGSYSQAMTKLGNQIVSAASSGYGGGGGSGGGGSGGGGGGFDDAAYLHGNGSDKTYKPAQTYTVGGNTYHSRAVQVGTGSVKFTPLATAYVPTSVPGAVSGVLKYKKYATGGLADSTGPAWLDGTPSEPEYVLNARQTDAFLKLADVLPSMMNGTSTTTSNTFGATYVNLSVNLESVSPDYDVDRMVDLVKDKLYDAGSYRNVNSLSFLR